MYIFPLYNYIHKNIHFINKHTIIYYNSINTVKNNLKLFDHPEVYPAFSYISFQF